MNLLVFAGSLAAVLALAGIAWALRLGRDTARIGNAEAAMREAEEAFQGFESVAAAVGEDGLAALIVGERGRLAVLKVHGARIAAREIGWADTRATPLGLLVETDDRRFGSVTIAGVDTLDVRRLVPQLTRV